MIEVEFCIGRVTCFVPASTVPFLQAGERYLTQEYKKAICDLATFNSYRAACGEFNKRYHCEGASSIKRSTFVKDMVSCGIQLIEAKENAARKVCESFGFDTETCKFKQNKLPESLRNRLPDLVTVSATDEIKLSPDDEWDPTDPDKAIPEGYLFRNDSPKATGVGVCPIHPVNEAIDDYEDQPKDTTASQTMCYSKPDSDTTKYVQKRRGTRQEVPPEDKQAAIDEYVAWRNANMVNPISKILYLWSVERDSSQVVYGSSDADLVPKQCKTHVAGGEARKKG